MFFGGTYSRATSLYYTFIGVFLAGLLTVFLYQPKMSDDYFNHYLIIQGGGSYWKYLQYIYHNWSGRIPQTILVWLAVTSETSRLVYQTASFVAFIATLMLAAALPLGRFPKILTSDMLYFWLIVAAIWFGNPAMAETVFWTTGSTAYLIPVFFMLLFLLPYNWFLINSSLFKNVPKKAFPIFSMFILGFIVGDYQEQVIVATSLLLPLWLLAIFLQKRIHQVHLMYWAGFIGFLLGVLVCILAPGNYARLATKLTVPPLQFLLYSSTYMIKYYFTPDLIAWLIPILLLGWLLSDSHTLNREKKHHRVRLLCACAYGLVSLLSLAPVYLTALFFTSRTAYPAIILFVISVAFFFTHLCNSQISLISRNRAFALCSIIAFLLVFDITKGIYIGLRINHALTQRELCIQQQLANGETDIRVPPLPSTTLSRHLFLEDALKDLETCLNRQAITKLYGLRTLGVDKNLNPFESKSLLPTPSQLLEIREQTTEPVFTLSE